MTIEERLNLLGEAEEFFANLSDAWKEVYKLWLRKAAALGTVKEWLELYRARMLEWGEWTDEELEKGLDMTVDWDYIQRMIDYNGMTEEEADFYMGWFGLAKWIMQGDQEQIDWFRKQQGAYDDLLQAKFGEGTLFSITD